ncbi:hypothetical protein MJD09_06230 [bacterium]|nr:hypothetical protein [bacterium]
MESNGEFTVPFWLAGDRFSNDWGVAAVAENVTGEPFIDAVACAVLVSPALGPKVKVAAAIP